MSCSGWPQTPVERDRKREFFMILFSTESVSVVLAGPHVLTRRGSPTLHQIVTIYIALLIILVTEYSVIPSINEKSDEKYFCPINEQ